MNHGLVGFHGQRLASPADRWWTSMIVVSVCAHVSALVVMVLVPGLLGNTTADEPREVMTISLGGAPGPRAGGMTSLGGRPVQQAAPEPPRVQPPPRPPAARQPEMTVPSEDTRRSPPPPRERLGSPPEETRATVPTEGPRERLGSTVADTGGQGVALGLSTGGGSTGGEIQLADFCCPEYLQTMLGLIQQNWNEKQPLSGTATLRFTIRRNGALGDLQVARTSGYAALDLAAQRAVGLAKFPPLPDAYPNPQLTINLNFQYRR